MIQLEPKCPHAVGASAQHPPAFTGCWCHGAMQGCSREDSCLGSVNLLGGGKRQLVSQNLPQGAGWFMCFVFLFHRGETFSFPSGQGCRITFLQHRAATARKQQLYNCGCPGQPGWEGGEETTFSGTGQTLKRLHESPHLH